MNRRCVPLLLGVLWLTGCAVEPAGPIHHEFQAIDRDQTETLRLTLNMGAGILRVGSGTEKLMRADFSYNVPGWKPELRYSSTAGRGDLSISQPHIRRVNFGHTENQWDLRLNRDVPIDMSVHFGAGEARLDLGGLALRNVEVDMGVGKVEMDLRGNPKHDYQVRIHGGVGEATVRLPAGVGITANARGGIGDIQVQGLRRESRGRYVNDEYGTAKVTVHVDVEGGVGAIHLIAE